MSLHCRQNAQMLLKIMSAKFKPINRPINRQLIGMPISERLIIGNRPISKKPLIGASLHITLCPWFSTEFLLNF